VTVSLRRWLLAAVVLGCLAGVVGSRAQQAEFTIRIAFLASQKGGKWKADDASHGDDEKIAK
jgi:hypothetical protein